MITYIISGPQGSGKSTLAKTIADGKGPAIFETTEAQFDMQRLRGLRYAAIIVEGVNFKSSALKEFTETADRAGILILVTNTPVPKDLKIPNLRVINLTEPSKANVKSKFSQAEISAARRTYNAYLNSLSATYSAFLDEETQKGFSDSKYDIDSTPSKIVRSDIELK